MEKVSIFFSLFLLICLQTRAQVEFNVSEESTMSLSGTSTIHDWTSTVNEIKGDIAFKERMLKKQFPESGSIIEKVKISLPVKSIESPKGESMDNKTHNALKAEEHPNIVFDLKEDEINSVNDNAGTSFTIAVAGRLTIAGHTKDIELDLEGQRMSKDKLKFKGSYSLNMTNYKVEPPSAMFGQIKTGEEVTIDFELVLVKE